MVLYLAEHFVTDAAGWGEWFKGFFEIIGAPDMTIDKAMTLDMWGGHECLATLNGGAMSVCVWKCNDDVDIGTFQTFVDSFTQGLATNKVYAVDAAMGLDRLTFREYLRETINMAQGRGSVGFLDGPALWYVHHAITDGEAWNNNTGAIIASKPTTPSDMQGSFEKGYGGSMTCFLGEKDACCLWSAPKDATKEEYKAVVDRFTQGAAANTPYLIDPTSSVGMANISMDAWSQAMFAFVKNAEKASGGGAQTTEGASEPVFTQ